MLGPSRVHRGAGCKSQVSTDADEQARGIVADFVGASLDTTTAKVHDSEVWNDLPDGDEVSVWADMGHVSAARAARVQGAGQGLGVMRKTPMGGKLDPLDDRINRVIAMVRAKVEHGPEPVSFRSLESNTRHQADRIGQRNTATSSSAGLVGVA